MSFINVLEDISPDSFPCVIPRAFGISLWNFEPEEENLDYQANLVVKVPGKSNVNFPMNLSRGSHRCRAIQGVLEIPVDAPGVVEFEVLLNGAHGASHKVRVHPVVRTRNHGWLSLCQNPGLTIASSASPGEDTDKQIRISARNGAIANQTRAKEFRLPCGRSPNNAGRKENARADGGDAEQAGFRTRRLKPWTWRPFIFSEDLIEQTLVNARAFCSACSEIYHCEWAAGVIKMAKSKHKRGRQPLTIKWTAEQLSQLGSSTDRLLAQRLGLPLSRVRAKRIELGIPPSRKHTVPSPFRGRKSGRSNRIDLVGKRFGLLEVISFAGKQPGDRTLWLCHCHGCGGETVVRGGSLRAGKYSIVRLRQAYAAAGHEGSEVSQDDPGDVAG